MGKFEQNAQAHVKALEDSITKLWRERYSLDWGHDCDCEFCDVVAEVPDETEQRAAEIDTEIADTRKLIEQLARHAKRHGVEVVVDAKK